MGLVEAGASFAILQRDLTIRTGIGPYNVKTVYSSYSQPFILISSSMSLPIIRVFRGFKAVAPQLFYYTR